jgi:hypothetical protein
VAAIKGGSKLEAALAKLSSQVAKPVSVRIGFMEGAAPYPDGTPVALVAAVQDFGAPSVGVPPRPFFRNMVAKRRGEWPAAIADAIKDNGYDAVKALGVVGNAIEGQLRQSIQETNSPPLKPATVARKGFDKPLIDTSHMINSITSEVKS